MIRDTQRLANGFFDLLIIGGGINGAAIANVAVDQGLKVALLEKNDFASGTSSKSTKLLHGGIRYLENFDFALVKEALKERFIQLKNVPYLAKPLAFIIPVYRNDKRPFLMMKFGVWLYDLLSGSYKVGRHRTLSAEEALRLEPNLDSKDLIGAVMYFDAQMDDARIVLENVLSAESKGAVVANYVEVREFIKDNGRVAGVIVYDKMLKKAFPVNARKVVSTVGPWTNSLLKMDSRQAKRMIRTTKGIHLVYEGSLTKHALLITSQQDNRIFFVIPWMGNSLIGTTDTNYIKSPDDVSASQKDIEYLLKETQRVFPNITLDEKKIIMTFAGLRPLVRKGGSPSSVSRKHIIEETFSGLIYVIGGKYTTYRKIAYEAVSKILNKRLDDPQLDYPLYGSGKVKESAAEIAKRFSIGEDSAEHLLQKYGVRYLDVLELTKKDAALKKKLCSCSPAIRAQVVYSSAIEMAYKEEDILLRLSLPYLPCKTHDCRKYISAFLKN